MLRSLTPMILVRCLMHKENLINSKKSVDKFFILITLLEMLVRKCEMYLALETMIVKVSSQIAIFRNVQLGRQSNHIHRLDAYFSSLFVHLYLSTSLLSLCLMNLLNRLRAVANLLLDLLNLILASCALQKKINFHSIVFF